jgi:glyoxylase-like metal-dependent hydrolase (beta-lactamase superfamily II)
MDPNEVTEEEQEALIAADAARHPENYPSVDTPADDGPMTLTDYRQAIREWAAEERGE